jgi:hypothetical protein
MLDGRAKIINDQDLRTAAKVPEGVFHALNEILGGLSVGDLAVRLAAVAQDDAKHVRLAALAIRPDHRCAGAEINLRLFAGTALHPPKRKRAVLAQSPHEPLHAVVAAGKTILDQILKDPLGAEPQIELRLDHRSIRLAVARPATLGRGAFARWATGEITCQRDAQRIDVFLRRPGGRNGWF